MPDRIQIAGVAISVLLLLVVLELVRRRKLTEEYSFVWIAASLVLIGLAARRDLLHGMAGWLGVYYPPALLLLVLIVMVFVTSLFLSVVVYRQRQQIDRLIEETAVLGAELRDLRDQGRAPYLRNGSDAPGEVVARPPDHGRQSREQRTAR